MNGAALSHAHGQVSWCLPWPEHTAPSFQRPICFSASRIGTGEILSTPLNGVYISRMMKIAEETASALRARVAITVELVGAKRPKLRKMAASHKTRTTNSGIGMGFCSDFRNMSHSVSRKLMILDVTWALAAACRSFFVCRSSSWLITRLPLSAGLSSAFCDA